MARRLSLEQQVLLVAVELEANGQSPFTAEEVAIAAWKRFPDSFAMEGYPEYPDSNRVYTKLMGKKGLAGRGWLVKVSEKQYQLTGAGTIMAEALGAYTDSGGGARAALTRDRKRLLNKLLSSRALAKVDANAGEGLVFHDACSFWDISPRSTASILRARLRTVEAVTDAAQKAIHEHGEIALTHGGLPIRMHQIELVARTHTVLLERFKDDLDVIRKRQDERRIR
jgi:hypothetical protein